LENEVGLICKTANFQLINVSDNVSDFTISNFIPKLENKGTIVKIIIGTK